MKARELGISIAIAGGFLASSATAQERNASSAEPVEVVVTATRRETPLQKTPKSMSAVSGETLDKSGSRDVSSLPRLAPGLTVIDGGTSNMRVVIRGVQGPGEATVGVYYDETPVSGAIGVASDAGGSTPKLRLVDVERVEVLRGPQGTLYGSGALGGALKVLFKRPVPWFESRVGAGTAYTEHGAPSYQLEGMINVPLVDDLSARAVAFVARRGGYVDNTFLGRDDINGETTRGGRLLLRFAPSSKLTLDAGVYYQDSRGEIPIFNYERGGYQSIAQVKRLNHDQLGIYNLTGHWDLGPVQATSVVSFARRRLQQVSFDSSYGFLSNIDNPQACARLRGNGSACSPEVQAELNDYVRARVPAAVYPLQTTDVGSGELRFSSQGDQRLLWTVGGFFSLRRSKLDNPQLAAEPTTGDILEPRRIYFHRFVDENLRQLAAFADASYRLLPALTLAAGARYFDYQREVGGYAPRSFDLLGAAAAPPRYYRSQEAGAATRVSLAYQVRPRTLLYTEASQGFRPGGVNQVIGLAPELEAYQADKTWNYELGAKTGWFDGNLLVNASAFVIDWYDMQVAGSRPDGFFRFISNAGRARNVGGEVELQVKPALGLELRARASYARARLSEDQQNGSVVAPGRKGDRIPYIPEVTAGLSCQYGASLRERLQAYGRADLSHVGRSFSEFRPDSPAYRALPSYWLLGVRVGVEGNGGEWGAQLFVDNVLDQVALSWLSAPTIAPGQQLATSAPPRTTGVQLYKRF